MDQGDSVIYEMRKISQEIPEMKRVDENVGKLANLTLQAQNISDQTQLTKIIDVLHTSITQFLKRELYQPAGTIADNTFDLIEEKVSGISNAEKAKNIALDFFKIPSQDSVIIGEDMLNRVVTIFEEKNDLENAATSLYTAGFLLHDRGRHEHAAAILGRSATYFQDLGDSGNKKIEGLIIKMLDVARELALKNDSNDQFYIRKANDISQSTGIKVKGFAVEAAHASFSEHLLTKSSKMVKSNYKHFGRKHKKKKDLGLKSKLLRRKKNR